MTCPTLRLGFILDHLAFCWPILAYMLCDIGLYWGYVGTTLRLLGCHDQMLAHLGAHAGPSWAYVGTIFCDLGLLRAILGLCCFFLDCHGPMLAHQGAILGLCWALLGPTLSHLGSVLANPAPSWNCVNARTNENPNPSKWNDLPYLENLPHLETKLYLGPSGLMLTHLSRLWVYMLCDVGLYWGYVGATLRLLGCHDQMLAHAGPSWAYVGTIFCDLGLLRAILGLCCFFWLSWAYVGPSRRHLGAMLGPPGPCICPTLSHLGSV